MGRVIVVKSDEQPEDWHWVITLQWNDRFNGLSSRTMDGKASLPPDSTASERYNEVAMYAADQIGQPCVIVFYLCEREVTRS